MVFPYTWRSLKIPLRKLPVILCWSKKQSNAWLLHKMLFPKTYKLLSESILNDVRALARETSTLGIGWLPLWWRLLRWFWKTDFINVQPSPINNQIESVSFPGARIVALPLLPQNCSVSFKSSHNYSVFPVITSLYPGSPTRRLRLKMDKNTLQNLQRSTQTNLGAFNKQYTQPSGCYAVGPS